MKRSEHILIKLEFDKAIKYLNSRTDITVDDYRQELGALRFFIYNMKIDYEPKTY
jgi:hypothetical protein